MKNIQEMKAELAIAEARAFAARVPVIAAIVAYRIESTKRHALVDRLIAEDAAYSRVVAAQAAERAVPHEHGKWHRHDGRCAICGEAGPLTGRLVGWLLHEKSCGGGGRADGPCCLFTNAHGYVPSTGAELAPAYEQAIAVLLAEAARQPVPSSPLPYPEAFRPPPLPW